MLCWNTELVTRWFRVIWLLNEGERDGFQKEIFMFSIVVWQLHLSMQETVTINIIHVVRMNMKDVFEWNKNTFIFCDAYGNITGELYNSVLAT